MDHASDRQEPKPSQLIANLTAQQLNEFRQYLQVVAEQAMDSGLQGKFGPSDLVQETLLNAEQCIDQYRGTTDAEARGWLKQILLNNLLDQQRHFRQTAKRDVTREQPIAYTGDSRAAKVEVADETRSPGSKVVAGEEIDQLMEAMSQLEAEHRRVLTLRNWERLSFAEIGERMNRSAAAARQLWVRALDRLQKLLSDEYEI